MAQRQKREQQDHQLGLFLSIVGSFTLPFVLISGIFGMVISVFSRVFIFLEHKQPSNRHRFLEFTWVCCY